MVLKRLSLIFIPIVLAFLLTFSSVSAQESWNWDNFYLPRALLYTSYTGHADAYPAFTYKNITYFVMRDSMNVVNIHKVNALDLSEIDTVQIQNAPSIAFGNGSECGSEGGYIYNLGCWMSTDFFPDADNMKFDIACNVRQQHVNFTYAINVYRFNMDDLSYETINIPVGGCNIAGQYSNRTQDIRFDVNSYGRGWYGGTDYERPIFYLDSDGYIHRVSWETCSLGVCTKKADEDIKDDRLPALGYDTLWHYLPIQEPDEYKECFGVWYTTYSCAPYIVFLANKEPYEYGRALWVMQLHTCPYGSYSCPTCCWTGTLSSNYEKMLIGKWRWDSNYEDEYKEVDDFYVFQRTVGTTDLWYILWHGMRRERTWGTGTGMVTCNDDECWYLTKFSEDWDEIREYNLSDPSDINSGFPMKYRYFTNITTDWGGGFSHWRLVNYEVPEQYDEIRLYHETFYGTASPPYNLTIEETSNPSNSLYIEWAGGSSGRSRVQLLNVTQFQGKSTTWDMWASSYMSFPPSLLWSCISLGWWHPHVMHPSLSTNVKVVANFKRLQNGTDACVPTTSSLANIYMVEEYVGCYCTEWYNTTECFDEDRKQMRNCVPEGCKVDVRYVYDPACEFGMCYPPAWYCYNSTHLAFRQSDCTWTSFNYCQYGCNETGANCYPSDYCMNTCPAWMSRKPFPDCSCYCTNYCIDYVDLNVSCECSEYPVLNYTEYQLNTSQWQENPVTLFADIASGMFALVGNLLVPLIILFLSIGFASIILFILKKAVP